MGMVRINALFLRRQGRAFVPFPRWFTSLLMVNVCETRALKAISTGGKKKLSRYIICDCSQISGMGYKVPM